MTSQEIKECSKLIDDFLGWKLDGYESKLQHNDGDEPDMFYQFNRYDKSGEIVESDLGGDSWCYGEGDTRPYHWFNLMDAVDFIEKLGYTSIIEKLPVNYDCHRVFFCSEGGAIAHGERHENKKDAIFLAVVDFVKWYNENKINK